MTAECLFQFKLPPAFTFCSSHLGASRPESCFWCSSSFWPCPTAEPAYLPFTGFRMCVHPPLMLLLLPQDLVPLKQGLWFDRLPVLGLQSNRPVGMVVLLSTCSWLLCSPVRVLCPWLLCSPIRPCPVPLHLLCFVLLAFPTLIVRTQGELVLNAEKPQPVLVWDHMLYSLLWQGQVSNWVALPCGWIEIYIVLDKKECS